MSLLSRHALGLGFVLLLSVASSSVAAVLARDDFAGHADGATPDRFNSGSGWARSWAIGPGAQAIVRRGDPAVRLEVGGSDTVRALARRLAVPAGVDGKPVFFRANFSIEASEAEINQVFGAWYFADAQGYRPGLPAVAIGVRGHLAARIGEKTAELKSRLEPGRRHTLVARLDNWDAASARFTRVTVWLDPDPTKPAEAQRAQASQTAPEGSGPVELLFFRIHNLNESRFHFYTVRLADRWEDACSD